MSDYNQIDNWHLLIILNSLEKYYIYNIDIFQFPCKSQHLQDIFFYPLSKQQIRIETTANG